MAGAEEMRRLRELVERAWPGRGNVVAAARMVLRESYTYDGNGNRASKTTAWGTINYTYDAENRMTGRGDIVYTYDQDGNLLSEKGLRREARYGYDGRGRMVYSEVTDIVERSRVTSRYAYDGLGRRTAVQEAGGNTIRTLYDGLSFEVIRTGVTFSGGGFTTGSGGVGTTGGSSNSGTAGSRYRWVGEGQTNVRTRSVGEAPTARWAGRSVSLYGKGEAVAARVDSGGAAYFGKDVLGSVRTVTGEYGQIEERYEYDAFGKPYQGEFDQGLNLGYTGKPYDTATGLYDYGYRDYAPEAARFTTVDPVRDGTNWFAYVNNDPVNYIDLWGLEEVYFIYTYTNSDKDQGMKQGERWTINDDIKYLKKNGISVKVLESANSQDIQNAFYDPEARMIVTSGHGYADTGKGIQTSGGTAFGPSNLDATKISSNLQTVIFENCYQGDYKKSWQSVLGNDVAIVSWKGKTTDVETKNFNTIGIFDRQDKNLRFYEQEIVESRGKKEK